MAKRQREFEKRDKAARKREKRGKRQAESQTRAECTKVSASEARVLQSFSPFLVESKQMLCFPAPELDANREHLEQLIDAGLLESEPSQDGYVLTASGYATMKTLSMN